MALKDIIGQEKAIGILQGILQRRRLASAYLFAGEDGIGKRTAAINFAKAVNCLTTSHAHIDEPQVVSSTVLLASPAAAYDACDACPSCHKIDAGTHPDVVTIEPEDRLIRTEEIRAIEESLSFRPFEGRRKVVIVDGADAMNLAAANTFLKTLEEPPANSLIILVTSRPDSLLPTIRSRCSRIIFHPLSLASCRKILEGKVPAEAIMEAVRLSMGRPGLAVASDLREDRDWFVGLFKAMLRAEKDAWADRKDMEKWFDLALTLMRDLAVLKISGSPARLFNPDLTENLERLGKSVESKGIIELYKELSFIKAMLLFNLNKSLTWNYTASLLRKELAP